MLTQKFASGLALLTVAAAVHFGAVPATADTLVKFGTLTCTGGQGVGLILGSKKNYNCQFAPSGGGGPDAYKATVTKIGLDIGVTGETTMVWAVLAAAKPNRPHVLAGTYAGVAADASLGLGAGAKILVGGSQKSITLQPLSVQGQTGVNLALGVAGLTLR